MAVVVVVVVVVRILGIGLCINMCTCDLPPTLHTHIQYLGVPCFRYLYCQYTFNTSRWWVPCAVIPKIGER
jgi:hypothetical protein